MCTDLTLDLHLWPMSRFSQRDWLSLVKKMFIIWKKQDKFNTFTNYYNWFLLAHILLWNGDELNLNLPKFAHSLYFFIRFLALPLMFLPENCQYSCTLVCNIFRSKCRSRWENLNHGQNWFQPIKLMNLVVPSPCENNQKRQ